MGLTPAIVEVPLDIARKQRPPLVHWGEALTGSALLSIEKALRDVDWSPRFSIEDGYRDSYEWYKREGRTLYSFDWSADDALLRELGRG
jgi:nucleoside-diphosphate-sugar epimerase